ncbi:hypothetical protein ACTXT7_008111 [Hymenolepis weldensis]
MWTFGLWSTHKIKEAIQSKYRTKTYYELLGLYATGQLAIKDLFATNNIASQKLGWFIKSIYPDSNNHLIKSPKFEGIQMSSWIPEMQSFQSVADLKYLLKTVRKKYENNDEIKDISRSILNGNDNKRLREIHTQADAYVKLLRIEHTFLQNVIESFFPFEYFEDPVDNIIKEAIDTLNKINNLLLARNLTGPN